MRPEHSANASGGKLDLLRRVDSYRNLSQPLIKVRRPVYPTQ